MKYGHLTDEDWSAFEAGFPSAYTWMLTRTLFREYEHLKGKPDRNTWESKRLAELEVFYAIPRKEIR